MPNDDKQPSSSASQNFINAVKTISQLPKSTVYPNPKPQKPQGKQKRDK